MPPPEKYKKLKSGVSLRRARPILIHTSPHSRLKTDYTAFHPEKTTTYMIRVVPITTHAHDRLKSIGKERKKKRQEEEARKGNDSILLILLPDPRK